MSTMRYNKRPGTGGVQGQLYETKLISLILFRLLRNEHIEEFYLASNYEGVGAFDDICFKAKIAGRERPMLVLIQAKHKENDDTRLDYDLIKNSYESLQKVKERFALSKCKPESSNYLFSGEFSDTECLFILYTNAIYHIDASHRIAYNHDILNNVLLTGENSQIFQLNSINENLEMLNTIILEEEITALAKHFTKFLLDKSMNIMNNTCILQYHVILAQHVVQVSDVKTEIIARNQHLTENKEWRNMTFRLDFFHTTDKTLTMLRSKIFAHILYFHFNKKENISLQCESSVPTEISSKHCVDGASTSTISEVNECIIEEQIALFLSEPSAITLAPLFGTHIIYDNDELKFIVDRPRSDVQRLKLVNVSTALIEDAKAIVVKNILSSLRINVPVTFGNVDLTIRGNVKKVERRLNHLTKMIDNMCGKAKVIGSYKVVAVEEGDGFSNMNGDIGGAIGNLLVHDKATRCLMFTQNDTLLNHNARWLFNKLQSKINDLHLYRFDTRAINNIPKLVLEYVNEAKDILNKVLLIERQSNHMGVEKILKDEIVQHQGLFNKSLDKQNSIKQQVFLHYHHKVQDWWLEKEASFLTKVGNIYDQTISNIDTEPEMSAMHNMFNVKMKYLNCHFTEDAMHSLKSLLEVHSKLFIATNTSELTIMKVIRCLRSNGTNLFSVIDFKCLLNRPDDVFSDLIVEIDCTRKVLIVVCNYAENRRIFHQRLDKLAEVTKDKNIIVITDIEFENIVLDYFSHLHVIKEQNQNLTNLMPESRTEIIKEATVIFQGHEALLSTLVNDDSQFLASIKGVVLERIIRNEPIIVGKDLKDLKYDEMNRLYIDRRVSRALPEHKAGIDYANHLEIIRYDDEYHTLKTFKNINADIVLIISTPGMGKSTLLSHMTHESKQSEEKFWIVRINFLEHTNDLKNWKNETVMNKSTMLNFMCQATLECYAKEINLEGVNSKVNYLQDYTNDVAVFEYNLFLRFYNERRVIFLFDGFDEICPDYKNEAINLLKFVKEYALKQSMWVTSRSYRNIVADLESVLGEPFVLEGMNKQEQYLFLQKFWQKRISRESFTEEQLKTIDNMPSFRFTYLSIIRVSLMNYITPTTRPFDWQSREHCETPLYDLEFGGFGRMATIDKLSGTPLLLYLLADYVSDVITRCGSNKSITDINIIQMIDVFLTKKLTMYYEIKYSLIISMPKLNQHFEKELKDCIDMYTKIGAYAILHEIIFRDDCCLDEFKDMPFNKENRMQIESMIRNIKELDDASGLISHITSNNIPIFIHKTFAEYFAIQFICDIWKSNVDINAKQLLYAAIRYYSFDLYNDWIPLKRKLDAELDCIIKDHFESKKLVGECDYNYKMLTTDISLTLEQKIRIYGSTLNDYESDIEHFVSEINIRWTRIDAVKFTYLNEFVARMKPHLKQYFPTAPLAVTPVDELTTKITSLHADDIKKFESAPKDMFDEVFHIFPNHTEHLMSERQTAVLNYHTFKRDKPFTFL